MAVIRLQSNSNSKTGVYYEFDPEIKSMILGKGGMGIVFKGKMVQEDTGKVVPVAIKAMFKDLSEETIHRAKREASIQVTHENVIRMYDFIETIDSDGKPKYHVISEYLDGETLTELLKKRGLISWKESLSITKKVLAGLFMLHEKGYVHRDIDPSNVMISKDGQVKLIDFGIAKQINEYHDEFQQGTQEGKFIGKVNYASPEQAKGNHWLTNATSDIYAVGILLFELLTGKLPFTGTTYEIVKGHLEQPVPISDISSVTENKIVIEGIKYIIRKATDKDQKKRYQSASEFISDIEKVLKEVSPIPGKIKKWIYVIPIVVLVLVSIFIYYGNLNGRYLKLISQANLNFAAAKYDNALSDYEKALSIKNTDSISNKILMLKVLTPAVANYVNSNYVSADSLFRIAATMNSADAYYYLGEMCYEGIGTPKNFKKGFDYTKKGAELGNKLAEYRLGLIYQNGIDVPVDQDKAIRYFERAGRMIDRGVDADNPELQFVKGNMFLQGNGVVKNEKMAMEFYEMAAKNNYPQAQYQLYEILNKSNADIAFQWLKKSAERGYPKAQFELGIILFKQNKFKEGIEYTKKAAEKKYAPAYRQLGALYQDKVKSTDVTTIQQSLGIQGDDSLSYQYLQLAVNFDMDYQKGKYDLALKSFEMAMSLVKTQPQNAEKYFLEAIRLVNLLTNDTQAYPYASQIRNFNYKKLLNSN